MLISITLALMLLNESAIDAYGETQQHCMIENIVHESAGEGIKGMRLVAEVTLNRIKARYRGAYDACTIVHDNAQYSWTLSPEKRAYTPEEYTQAARVLFSYLYYDLERILPENTLHYINRKDATDLSWYDPKKVVYRFKNHEFLKL